MVQNVRPFPYFNICGRFYPLFVGFHKILYILWVKNWVFIQNMRSGITSYYQFLFVPSGSSPRFYIGESVFYRDLSLLLSRSCKKILYFILYTSWNSTSPLYKPLPPSRLTLYLYFAYTLVELYFYFSFTYSILILFLYL